MFMCIAVTSQKISSFYFLGSGCLSNDLTCCFPFPMTHISGIFKDKSQDMWLLVKDILILEHTCCIPWNYTFIFLRLSLRDVLYSLGTPFKCPKEVYNFLKMVKLCLSCDSSLHYAHKEGLLLGK